MLSKQTAYQKNLSGVRTSDLLRRFFLVIKVFLLRFCFVHLTTTVSFFFKGWHAWISSGFTSWLVRDNALQMLFSRTSSPTTDAGTGFISSDSGQWYWALLTAFLSKLTILSVSKQLQFLLIVSFELRISYCLRKSLKRLVRSDSLDFFNTNKLFNYFFERFSGWLLVQTIIIYKWYMYLYLNKLLSKAWKKNCPNVM